MALRIPPNAAFPPAKEKGVEATAVPKTLAVEGAPNAAKSVTTLRGGEPGTIFEGEDGEDGGAGLEGEEYVDGDLYEP